MTLVTNKHLQFLYIAIFRYIFSIRETEEKSTLVKRLNQADSVKLLDYTTYKLSQNLLFT